MNRAVIALLIVTFALAAQGQDGLQEVDGKVVDGIVALTTQVKAVSLGDLTRALNLDLTLYERSDRATTTFRTVYWRRQTQDVRPQDPLLYFSLTNVEVQLPVPSGVGSPPRPYQSIKLVFAKGRCISTRALEERLHIKFRSYTPPIMSSAQRASESIATAASEPPARPRSSYFLRVPGTSGSNKTDAVENGLDLDGECSQQVGISKSFNYDYWK